MERPPKLEYRDVEIELTDLREGTFSVRVVGRTPSGREMRADEAERPVFAPDTLDPLIRKLDRRRLSQEELKSLGQKLASLLLPGKVRELYLGSLDEVRRNREG